MRPLRLRIKGATAFVQEVDLDFEGLDLFAITGPTGAGKTSLLDAMTIALYGRSARLGDDLRQVISPLAERAHFFFEFRARGRDYRITRVLFRTRPTTVALELRREDGEWQSLSRGVREATTHVERILGLDFDSFTKVVLLPQNAFDAFLRGKPDERRSILIRLLSLEVYGQIQKRANEVAADARAQADLLTGLLARDHADATPERLAEMSAARAAAEAAVADGTARIAALEGAARAALDLRERRNAHRSAAGDLADHERLLGDVREEHAAAAKRLEEARRALEQSGEEFASVPYDADRHLLLTRAQERAIRLDEVIPALDALDAEDSRGRAHIAALTRQREELSTAAGEAEAALRSAEAVAVRARTDLEERQQRFGDRRAIATLVERERRYREDRAQEKALQQALEGLVAREAALASEREAAGHRLAEAHARLDEVRLRFDQRRRDEETVVALHARTAQLADTLAQVTERGERARTALEQALALARERRATLDEVAQARQTAEALAHAAEERLRVLERTHAAHALRAGLAPGQPCPVCTTPVRRVPPTEPLDDLENARRAVDDGRRRLQKAQRAERDAAAAASAADESVRAATATRDEIQSERDRLERELRDALPPDLRDDARWRPVLQSRAAAAAAARTTAEQEVQATQNEISQLEATLAGVAAQLATLPARIREQHGTLDDLRARCDETEQVLAALLERPPGPDAAARLQAIDVSLREAEQAVVAATAAVEAGRDRLRRAQEAAGASERAIAVETVQGRARAERRGVLARERDEILRALDAVVPGRPDVSAAIAEELAALADARRRRDELGRRLENARREQERAAREVAEVTARLAELERRSGALRAREEAARRAAASAQAELEQRLAEVGVPLAPEGDQHEQLGRVVQHARHEHEAAVRAATELAAEERTLTDRIRRAAECREQRDAARARADIARELGQLLGATNLQTYVLADAMRVLVEDGSEHLRRLSDGRYRLQAQDLDFHVVDAWNGDAVRSVKTLSGGETFLTSLALALALAERLADLAAGAHGHEALESLFIDEGFGALDSEETLETVVQAIESLQTHDRLVGIVTHLASLADRMPAQIKVRKAPAGSHVEIAR